MNTGSLPPLLRLLCLVFLLLSPGGFPVALGQRSVGGYRPIRDVGDPYVVEIGRFAVAEHNKQAKPGLVFVRVVGGESQVVAGTNYRLLIEAAAAAGGTGTYQYRAVVYDRPWDRVRTLTSFDLVLH